MLSEVLKVIEENDKGTETGPKAAEMLSTVRQSLSFQGEYGMPN